jgi:hypothetical protein
MPSGSQSSAGAVCTSLIFLDLLKGQADRPQPLPNNFVDSSISCARSWTVSARRTQICAATSFLALWRSNSPFSKPPIRPEFS